MDHSVETMIISSENKTEGNIEWINLPAPGPMVPQILHLLYQKEIQSVIVEGGGYTLNRFIESGLWDEARVFTGNKTFGDGVKSPELPAEPAQELQIAGALLHIWFNK